MFVEGIKFCLRALARFLALALLAPQPAAADEVASGQGTFSSPSAASDAALGLTTGGLPETGLPLGGWIVHPSLLTGVIFNDNIYQQPIDRRADLGLLLSPVLEADLDTGLHKTTLFVRADAQIYPGQGASFTGFPILEWDAAPTNLTGDARLSHRWMPFPDTAVQATVDYSRQNGLFSSNLALGALQDLGLFRINAISSGQQYSNQYSALLSVEKNFGDRWFVRGATGGEYVSYDSRPTPAYGFSNLTGGGLDSVSQDGWSSQLSLRGGLWLTPYLYGFVEPAGDFRFYANSASDTNGYRVVAGLGSDLIGLFRGEIYGGYQSQSSAHGYFGTTSSPAFGARLIYYPTPYMTFTASLDDTLSAGAEQTTIVIGNVVVPLPMQPGLQASAASANSKTLLARLQGEYALSQYWKAYIRAGYGETDYANPGNVETIWSTGVGLSYNFWRNVSVTVAYQFTRTFSTSGYGGGLAAASLGYAPLTGTPSGYAQNLVSAGVTYRY
jgi:hypothetical protein